MYLDNFFTSVKLVEDLEVEKVFCAGTVRVNKLQATPELLDKTTLKNMQRGDYLYRTKQNVTVTVWKDNRHIHMISNAYPVSGDTTVKRKRKTDGVVEQVPCPSVICGYNKFMGGVDQNDQKRAYYSINRKSKRWWLRIFLYFLDVAVVNAHCLYIKNRKQTFHPPLVSQSCMDLLAFRTALIHSFCDGFTSRKSVGRPPYVSPSHALSTGNHHLVHVSDLGMPKGRCQHCTLRGFRRKSNAGRPKRRRETYYACSACNIRLCKIPCFDLYHK